MVYCCCITGVLLVYYWCTTGVLLVYYWCTTGVLLVYYWCMGCGLWAVGCGVTVLWAITLTQRDNAAELGGSGRVKIK